MNLLLASVVALGMMSAAVGVFLCFWLSLEGERLALRLKCPSTVSSGRSKSLSALLVMVTGERKHTLQD